MESSDVSGRIMMEKASAEPSWGSAAGMALFLVDQWASDKIKKKKKKLQLWDLLGEIEPTIVDYKLIDFTATLKSGAWCHTMMLKLKV